MSLNAGNADCTTGLSKRIYDAWTADARAGFSLPLSDDAKGCVRSLCWAVAKSVVDEVQANAAVNLETGKVS